jgi:hypothetical protein
VVARFSRKDSGTDLVLADLTFHANLGDLNTRNDLRSRQTDIEWQLLSRIMRHSRVSGLSTRLRCALVR